MGKLTWDSWVVLLLTFGTILSLAAVVVFSGSAPARAQVPQCDELSQMLENLSVKHQEELVAQAESGNEQVLLITATADGSTWTAIMVKDTLACIVAAGVAWQTFAPPPAGEGI